MRPRIERKVMAMKAYSLDLRQRVVEAVDRGQDSLEDVAALFGVGLTFVKKMLRQRRENGDLKPLPHGGGKPLSLRPKHLRSLRAAIKQNNDLTLEELRDHLAATAQVSVSAATVSRALSGLGLPRKKSSSAERARQS
jgi:transposase